MNWIKYNNKHYAFQYNESEIVYLNRVGRQFVATFPDDDIEFGIDKINQITDKIIELNKNYYPEGKYEGEF